MDIKRRTSAHFAKRIDKQIGIYFGSVKQQGSSGNSKHIKGEGIKSREIFLGENDGEYTFEEAAKSNIIAIAVQYIYSSNYKGKKPPSSNRPFSSVLPVSP